jgi:shikimate dehydrogenase
MTITAHTRVAGVAGAPIRHSLSPLLHNAWLKEAGIDGVYVAFAPPQDAFPAFAEGLRGGAVVGLNVTIPFKQQALTLADDASGLARASGAANLLLFHENGRIEARNTDGEGMMAALAAQAPHFDPRSGPALVLGAGGAARGAVAALLEAGSPQVIVVNRTLDRAEHLAQALGPRVRAFDRPDWAAPDAVLIVNATSLGLGGGAGPRVPWKSLPDTAVAMDMVYKPLRTEFLAGAEERGLTIVDGLEMLIRQAIPSFQAFYGQPPPPELDERRLLLDVLEAGG